MEKIKEWLSNHNIFIYIVGLLLILGSIGLFDNLIGKRYQKFYSNQHTSSIAVNEFKGICKGYKLDEDNECEKEYYVYYDNKREAISSFMILAHRLNNKYANGSFCHCYLGCERIYQCYDKKKNLIAVALFKHKGGFWLGYGGGFEEMKPFYEIRFYVEK